MFLVVPAPTAPAAIIAGQADTFQDNTADNWGGGDNLAVQSGGPAGASDLYLHLEALGGSGSGSKLSTFNAIQWAGDYAAAGITSISMDLLNPNTSPVGTPLDMRIVLFGPNGSRWSSTNANVIPADNTWHHVTFPLAEAALTQVVAGDTYGQTISNVSQLMIRYDAGTTPSSSGSTFAGTLGIDNVMAVAVPEPGSAGVLAGGAFLVMIGRSKVRR
jgi:hypothetical protein